MPLPHVTNNHVCRMFTMHIDFTHALAQTTPRQKIKPIFKLALPTGSPSKNKDHDTTIFSVMTADYPVSIKALIKL